MIYDSVLCQLEYIFKLIEKSKVQIFALTDGKKHYIYDKEKNDLLSISRTLNPYGNTSNGREKKSIRTINLEASTICHYKDSS